MGRKSKPHAYNFCIFTFNAKCSGIETYINGNTTHDGLVNLLSTDLINKACYCVYDFIVDSKSKKSKVIMINWAPPGSPVKERMCIASSASGIMAQLGGVHK